MMDKDRGFTLVELLVVISVIALLMGILVPALGKARNAAKRTFCQSNLRQIGVAFRAYLDDNRDIMPLACAFPWDITDTANPCYAPPITKLLGPLLKQPEVFICKSDIEQKYYLREGKTSYYYRGRHLTPTECRDGLGGRTISTSFFAQNGAKEKNIEVMKDFDDFHPRSGRKKDPDSVLGINYVSGVNYLYADWHVSDNKNQD
jgi:prepilin-type N-terminal cleavage/methylation domain-containing protein/prepilin-type processing-associated H-X9-DG protein